MTELQVRELSGGYGRTPVLFDVDIRVGAGEIVALLGRNGVGKTTLLRSVVGLLAPTRGSVRVGGVELARRRAFAAAAAGVQFIPDDRGIFATLTVAENLELGRLAGRGRAGGTNGGASSMGEEVLERFPVLRERAAQQAGVLSGGERGMLAMARALLARPRFLLVDEFSEGLQPSVIQQLARILRSFTQAGGGVLLVDQNARFAIATAQRVAVMAKGRIVDEGLVEEFSADPNRLHANLVL
jgi:branched-chain amino acid transport system ATP-binding protein